MTGVTITAVPESAIADFVKGYLVCALWSTNDESDESGGDPLDYNYDIDAIHPGSALGAREECLAFMQSNWEDLQGYSKTRDYRPEHGSIWEYAGHDFWLTRNGHGAGFWDRGLGELGDRLSVASKTYAGQDIYVGDDGKLYLSGFESRESL